MGASTPEVRTLHLINFAQNVELTFLQLSLKVFFCQEHPWIPIFIELTSHFSSWRLPASANLTLEKNVMRPSSDSVRLAQTALAPYGRLHLDNFSYRPRF